MACSYSMCAVQGGENVKDNVQITAQHPTNPNLSDGLNWNVDVSRSVPNRIVPGSVLSAHVSSPRHDLAFPTPTAIPINRLRS